MFVGIGLATLAGSTGTCRSAPEEKGLRRGRLLIISLHDILNEVSLLL